MIAWNEDVDDSLQNCFKIAPTKTSIYFQKTTHLKAVELQRRFAQDKPKGVPD